jgi:hypothetical protein
MDGRCTRYSRCQGHEDEEPESKEIRSLCQPNVAPKSLGLVGTLYNVPIGR